MIDRDDLIEMLARHIVQPPEPGMALSADNVVIQQLGWNPSADEHRRAFIIENFVQLGDYNPDPEYWFQWLKHGPKEQPKPMLRPVK